MGDYERLCLICDQKLTIPNTEDDDGPAEYPDDVELRCECHYHWQCLIDFKKPECPKCGKDACEPDGRFLAIVRNEGGVTEDFDFGAVLADHRFLSEHPEIERMERFLALVEQGDADIAEELLTGPDAVDVNCTARNSKETALHKAAYNNDADAIEMLLRYGADRNALDDSGQTPLQCALEVKAEQAAAVLSS